MNREYTNNPIVTRVAYSQDEKRENQVLQVSISQGSAEETLSIIRPYPVEDSYELFEANKIWIEIDDEDSQKEYGKYKVSYYANEAYFEFWCDSVRFIR